MHAVLTHLRFEASSSPESLRFPRDLAFAGGRIVLRSVGAAGVVDDEEGIAGSIWRPGIPRSLLVAQSAVNA
jgi:hypothetical protein